MFYPEVSGGRMLAAFATGSVAMLIAGPYFFAGRTRSGRWNTHPTNYRELIGISAFEALIAATVWTFAPSRTRR